jgi:methenyltetrahydromethanopterin cyclohydrolase
MPKSLNEAGLEIIAPVLDDPQRFGARIVRSPGGATILDMGIEVDGSWLGAKRWVEAAHGGLAEVTFGRMQIKELDVPTVEVVVDNPLLSVIACEAGVWKIGSGEFAPVASGPARVKARDDHWTKLVEYEDPFPYALVQLQMPRLPDDSALEYVATACAIPLDHVTALVAPSASLVGGLQVVSRAFEQCLVALVQTTSFDLTTIVHGYGRAPVPPVMKDEILAMGRINDALVYGGSSGLWLRHPDDETVRRTAEALPFSVQAGADYDKGYAKIYETYGHNFFNIPHNLDVPAKVMMANLLTGSVFVAGKIDEELLYRSFTEARIQ